MQHESNQRMHRDNHLWSVCPPLPQVLAPADPWNQATQLFLTQLDRPSEGKAKKL